jgi:hypothetical protein
MLMAVMIGIDPHKSSHTAVVISVGEERLGELRVYACPSQAEQLLGWAAGWPERAWAVEGAAGLGCLLAQQLVAAGEQVLDVPPKLAARGAAAAGRGHQQERHDLLQPKRPSADNPSPGRATGGRHGRLWPCAGEGCDRLVSVRLGARRFDR